MADVLVGLKIAALTIEIPNSWNYTLFLLLCSCLTFPHVGQPVAFLLLHEDITAIMEMQKIAIRAFLVRFILFTFKY